MPSFRRRDSVIDADRVEESTVEPDRSTDAEQARALADEAEAEAAEADAMAAAARARARAARLRREALTAKTAPATQTAAGTQTADTEAEPADTEAEPADTEAEPAESDVIEGTDESTAVELGVDESPDAATPRKRRVPRPRVTGRGIAVALTILAVLGSVALLALSGFFIVEHRNADKVRQQNAEYSAAARQSVVTLMSLDFNNAEADVQRIIDNSTGQFKDDFQSQAADFVKVAQDSKVITEVTVNSTAVESMSDDKAEVLVAASSRVTNSAGANQEPRTWRLSVSLERENDQIKMAKVEFVP
ncbi:hypothetical protein [Mycobacterium sp. 236(2023)]|uniref:hypothetical protein n=1 Tax=Mycobacterium sp. 236(2023) TaxID=3038163 RepID=UPI0024153496|nr:hypothetical protein [Mycobacterium sp. 236(2023)]MDG4667865.1 hypothetical protein [Mycobacterium sp. 236(2023)]